MSKVSQFVGAKIVPENIEKDFTTCLFCFEEISKGGCWAGKYHIGVCKKCCDKLVDILIDTLEDADEEYIHLDADARMNKLIEITKKSFLKKEKQREKVISETSMKKIGLLYYLEIGIIDFFGITFSPEELKNKIDIEDCETIGNILTSEDIDICVDEIRRIIHLETKEEPHTIQFFAIPNPSYNTFDIGCVAKIMNNGSTYMFSNNKEYLQVYKEYLQVYNEYDNDIKSVL